MEKLTRLAGQRIRNYDLSRRRDYLLSRRLWNPGRYSWPGQRAASLATLLSSPFFLDLLAFKPPSELVPPEPHPRPRSRRFLPSFLRLLTRPGSCCLAEDSARDDDGLLRLIPYDFAMGLLADRRDSVGTLYMSPSNATCDLKVSSCILWGL